MANHKRERVQNAIKYLTLISKYIVNAEYTEDDILKGMLLYLDNGNVFELKIREDIHGPSIQRVR